MKGADVAITIAAIVATVVFVLHGLLLAGVAAALIGAAGVDEMTRDETE